ncbi:MAG: hypothetical protein Q8898_17785, partial [Bacillota bacterium]|nr:hypothetical protein [Bacillota bacterium]
MSIFDISGHAWIAYWATQMICALVQGSLTILLVWSVTRLFPEIHPAIRCWLWRLAFMKQLIAFLWIKPFILYIPYGFKDLIIRWASATNLHLAVFKVAVGYRAFETT